MICKLYFSCFYTIYLKIPFPTSCSLFVTYITYIMQTVWVYYKIVKNIMVLYHVYSVWFCRTSTVAFIKPMLFIDIITKVLSVRHKLPIKLCPFKPDRKDNVLLHYCIYIVLYGMRNAKIITNIIIQIQTIIQTFIFRLT